MDIHKKVELEQATGKSTTKSTCRICRLIRVYLLFAIPTLALFWLGVDFGVGTWDPKFPYGCDLMGFKSKITPCLDVCKVGWQKMLRACRKRGAHDSYDGKNKTEEKS